MTRIKIQHENNHVMGLMPPASLYEYTNQMIHKIACPFDFSSAAINAVEYAANLARINEARLTLIHIQSVYAGGVLLSKGEQLSVPEAISSSHRLEEYAKEIQHVFNIECDFEVHTSVSHFSNSISRVTHDYDLIVMGTNGESDLLQFYTGSGSYKTAKKAGAAVLVIPETYSYKSIGKILYASDYAEGDPLHLEQLMEFVKPVAAELGVIHISSKDTPLSTELYRSFVSYIEDIFSSIANLHFKRIVSNDPVEAIESYVNQSGADLLAVKFKKHSLLYRLFHRNLIKEVIAEQQLPLLVFHD